jgi:DNA-binding NtrC family response regulator
MAKYFEREDSRPELPVTIPPEGVDLKALLHRIEKEYYEKALELAGGNLSHAAELLSINPPAFRKAWRERFAPDAGEA